MCVCVINNNKERCIECVTFIILTTSINTNHHDKIEGVEEEDS